MPENAKVITTAALMEKFQQALEEKWGYIWATAGEMWTAAKQKQLEQTTDADRENSRKYGSKWIGRKVADCSGLFSWAFKQLGGYMYHGSDTMFRKYCTATGVLNTGQRTDGAELKPGTAVFVWKEAKKKYTHVGLYMGGGVVIEAMGAQNGVTTSKITATKWTHWGELKGVDYSGSAAAEPAAPAADSGTETKWRPTIRKGSKGAVVKEMQEMLQKLGYSLGICGVDGDYGTATAAAVRAFQSENGLVVDGVCGPMTWDALEKAVKQISPKKPAESEKVYAVIISGLDKTTAEALAANYPANSRIIEGSVA